MDGSKIASTEEPGILPIKSVNGPMRDKNVDRVLEIGS
jgi:hypothetical protein